MQMSAKDTVTQSYMYKVILFVCCVSLTRYATPKPRGFTWFHHSETTSFAGDCTPQEDVAGLASELGQVRAELSSEREERHSAAADAAAAASAAEHLNATIQQLKDAMAVETDARQAEEKDRVEHSEGLVRQS